MNLTLLIDLDDTLLPHSTERFLPAYIKALTNHLSELAPPQKIQEVLFSATNKAMENSDPSTTLKEVFDKHFYPGLGTQSDEMKETILDFYTNKYPSLSPISEPDQTVVEFLQHSWDKNVQLLIATNPIFPQIATNQRLAWAGIPMENLSSIFVSTYEYFHFVKPNPAYFTEMLAQIGWPDNQIVMIGNDYDLDIHPAKQVGLATYWVTDDYTKDGLKPQHGAGPLKDFYAWLETRTDDHLTPDLRGFTASLETLRSTPAALQTLLHKVSPSEWSQKPDFDSWGIAEILCHFRDVDNEVHIPRFEYLIENPAPYITAVDADTWAAERRYIHQDSQKALIDFIKHRKNLINLISALPKSVEEKEIRHTIFGPITLDEIMRIAARHDRLHMQQIYALLQNN